MAFLKTLLMRYSFQALGTFTIFCVTAKVYFQLGAHDSESTSSSGETPKEKRKVGEISVCSVG